MHIQNTTIPDVLIIEPKTYSDERGFFYESFNARRFKELTGVATSFVQDNHSKSAKHVLRGLHYQIQQPQGKLVRVVAGAVFDVAVDIRKHSLTFGHWVGAHLTAENKLQMWIPKGFAHGFIVTSDSAEVFYKTTDYWAHQHERCILWNDPAIGIEWPLDGAPILSGKDQSGTQLRYAEHFA